MAEMITLVGASQFDEDHAFPKTMRKSEELVKEYYQVLVSSSSSFASTPSWAARRTTSRLHSVRRHLRLLDRGCRRHRLHRGLAVAVVYSSVLAIFVYRTIGPRGFPRVLYDSARFAATSLFCIGTASAFAWAPAYFQIPRALVAEIEAMGL
jgi:hypothetical protein